MKASIFIAAHNKRVPMSNVIHSISIQKTSFPFEVCFVDDKSDPNEECLSILDHKLPHTMWKYCRLMKNVGCGKSQSECLSMMSKDSEAIILQSADVMYAGDDVLEKLVVGLEPMVCTMAEVRNVAVPETLHREWDKLEYFLREERLAETLSYINSDPKQPRAGSYKMEHVLFSGPRQPEPQCRWYFFLGAIRTKDIYKTCFRESCYDVDLSASLHKEGFSVKYVDAVALHQKHPVG